MSGYINNINGLRAFAVLAVVLYHFSFPFFTGGFVGVDVFLVISGFLITKIVISQEISSSTITAYFSFLLRRVYRLTPALTSVIILVVLSGYFLLDSSTYEFLAKSSLSSVFYFSNYFYFEELDYFGPDSNLVSLLHTWSLSLEMQFYVLWGMVLFAFKKRGVGVLLVISCIVFLSSLCASILGGDTLWGSYYSITARMHEFMLGVVCALYLYKYKGFESSNCFMLSLLLLGGVLVFYESSLAYPSFLGVIPSALAALLILNINSKAACFVFGNRYMEYVGRMSYSIYLVHWPVSVFLNYMIVEPLDIYGRVLAILIVFILSSMIYHFIERHYLNYDNVKRIKRYYFSVLFFLLAFISMFVIIENGIPSRLEEGEYKFVDVAEDLNKQRAICDYHQIDNINVCYFGKVDSDKKPDIVLMGDSHAWHMLSGLDRLLKMKGIRAAKINQAGGTLPSIVGNTYTREGPKPQTRKYFPLLAKLTPKIVIMSARWGLYSNSKGTYGSKSHYQVVPDVFVSAESSEESFRYSMDKTLDYVTNLGGRVLVLGQVPEIGVSREYCAEVLPFEKYLGSKCSANSKELNETYLQFSNGYFEGKDFIDFVNMFELMCQGAECSYKDSSGTLFYKDGDHITYDAAIYLVDKYISEIFTSIYEENL